MMLYTKNSVNMREQKKERSFALFLMNFFVMSFEHFQDFYLILAKKSLTKF